MAVILIIEIFMAVDYFGYFGITKEVNAMPINSQGQNFIFSIGRILIQFFDLTKEILNELLDWNIDKDPDYPTSGECKFWIKRQNPRYVISKNDEKEILMF